MLLSRHQAIEAQSNAGVISMLSYILLGIAPLLPLGLLSHFCKAQSTYAERVITMLWLGWGILMGLFLTLRNDANYRQAYAPVAAWDQRLLLIVLCISYAAPAFAGFVEVGLMYSKFGTCVQV